MPARLKPFNQRHAPAVRAGSARDLALRERHRALVRRRRRAPWDGAAKPCGRADRARVETFQSGRHSFADDSAMRSAAAPRARGSDRPREAPPVSRLLALLALLLAAGAASAADPWPTRPTRMILGYVPGGSTA